MEYSIFLKINILGVLLFFWNIPHYYSKKYINLHWKIDFWNIPFFDNFISHGIFHGIFRRIFHGIFHFKIRVCFTGA